MNRTRSSSTGSVYRPSAISWFLSSTKAITMILISSCVNLYFGLNISPPPFPFCIFYVDCTRRMPLAEACDAACCIHVAECPFIAVCAMVYAIEYQTPFGRVKISSKELLQRRSVHRKSEKPSSGIADYHDLSYAKRKVAKERSELSEELSEVSQAIWGKKIPQMFPKSFPKSDERSGNLRHFTASAKRALKKPWKSSK